MAASPRLSSRSVESVAVVGTGAFGARVAELFARQTRGTVVRHGDAREAFGSTARLVVVAAWRPSPALFTHADLLAFLCGKRWLPVVVDHPVLRVGPLVCPPQAPCYQCFRRRQVQHDGEHHTTAALYRAYDRDPNCGPRGYLPQHARIAAAMATGVVEALRAALRDGRAGPVGEVREMRLFDQQLSMSRVIACHDCRRCAPRTPAGQVERVESLVSAMVDRVGVGR